MTKLIEARDLQKSFALTHAVDGLTLSVAAGEIYGLVGSDGAGKTTTLRLLVGALKSDAGERRICGFDVDRQGEQARAQVGYLSQRFSLYDDLTVLENIRFFAELRGLRREAWLPRCTEILEFVGLAQFMDRRAGQLSGGMKQKLGLATALVSRPRVLLLDEPTTGVDPVTRQDFWKLIIRLVSDPGQALDQNGGEGISVLLTTPYMDEASRCHRVGFMRSGKLITEGTPSGLRATLDGQILELRAPDLHQVRSLALALTGVQDVRLFGDRLHLRVQPGQAQAVISALMQTVQGKTGDQVSARLASPSLEDVFIALAQAPEQERLPGAGSLKR